ncbi:DUF2804 family protein [Treponema sp. OMZ 840]|uniref:DUF2804 family protein n=1 Tax=Treponema sp. OMZ 840 TaxID=244313 RepID=UPI003D8BDC67
MYTRNIEKAPRSVVCSGKPTFGDFRGIPDYFDIRKLKQPFSLMKLPSFITDSRIRTNLSFSFLTDDYLGVAEIIDAHYFGFAEITIWEKESARKLSYRSFIVFRKRLIPYKLKSGMCKSLRTKRRFTIRWNYDTGNFSAVCRLKGDSVRPNTYFSFSADLHDKTCAVHTSVIPAPLMRRCAAVHHCAPVLKGTLTGNFFVKNGKELAANVHSLGFFTIRRSYYRLRLHSYALTVLGTADNKNIRFNLYTSNQDPVDSDLYNENVLFTDGESTPLPPVTITHPYGLLDRWIIQDTENMIDLSFTPLSDTVRKESILILRTEYHTIYGKCEGSIRDKNGELFTVKDLCAIAKKKYLRL